jgi:hypothetical protein
MRLRRSPGGEAEPRRILPIVTCGSAAVPGNRSRVDGRGRSDRVTARSGGEAAEVYFVWRRGGASPLGERQSRKYPLTSREPWSYNRTRPRKDHPAECDGYREVQPLYDILSLDEVVSVYGAYALYKLNRMGVAKKLLVLVAFISAFAVSVLCKQSNWVNFKSDLFGYQASFPSVPNRVEDPVRTPYANTAIFPIGAVQLDTDKELFSIMVIEQPGFRITSNDNSLKEIFDQRQQEISDVFDCESISGREVRLGNAHGREIRCLSRDVSTISQWIIVGQFIYNVEVFWEGDHAPSDNATRFLDSFKLL